MHWRQILNDYSNPPRSLPIGKHPGVIEDPADMTGLAWRLLREPSTSREQAVAELSEHAAKHGVLDAVWYREASPGLPPSSIPVGATNRQIIDLIASADETPAA